MRFARTVPFVFLGLDLPNLAAVIDVDADTETVFGDDPSLDQVIWTGPQPSLSERCRGVGVYRLAPSGQLPGIVGTAVQKKRKVHFLPPYRMDQTMQIADLCGLPGNAVHGMRRYR